MSGSSSRKMAHPPTKRPRTESPSSPAPSPKSPPLPEHSLSQPSQQAKRAVGPPVPPKPPAAGYYPAPKQATPTASHSTPHQELSGRYDQGQTLAPLKPSYVTPGANITRVQAAASNGTDSAAANINTSEASATAPNISSDVINDQANQMTRMFIHMHEQKAIMDDLFARFQHDLGALDKAYKTLATTPYQPKHVDAMIKFLTYKKLGRSIDTTTSTVSATVGSAAGDVDDQDVANLAQAHRRGFEKGQKLANEQLQRENESLKNEVEQLRAYFRRGGQGGGHQGPAAQQGGPVVDAKMQRQLEQTKSWLRNIINGRNESNRQAMNRAISAAECAEWLWEGDTRDVGDEVEQ